MDRRTILGITVFLVISSGMLAHAQYRSFLGELIIKTDGVYTKVHTYKHGSSGAAVTLIGSFHTAVPEYFRAIEDILRSCEVVIFEGPRMPRRTAEEIRQEVRTNEDNWRDWLFHTNLDTAWVGAFFIEPQKQLDLLGLVRERDYFDNSLASWVSGDEGWYQKVDWKALFSEFQNKASRIPSDRKRAIVNLGRHLYLSAEQGRLTREDLIIVMPYAYNLRYGSGDFWAIMDELFLKERDEMAMTVLDAVVQNRLQLTCVKFGWAHMVRQRKILENRGYILQNSWELRAIPFR